MPDTVSFNAFCKTAKERLEQSVDFDTKRQLFLDYVEKIVFNNGRVDFHGSIPVKLVGHTNKGEDTEAIKMQFCITDVIPRIESYGRKNRKPKFGIPSSRKEYEKYATTQLDTED